MMRISTLFWLCVVFVAVLGLYKVKYKVHEVKSEVASLENKLADESRAVHVLEAEWSYLTRPERVRELANQHLKLEPLTSAQMMMPASLVDLQNAPVAEVVAASVEDGQFVLGEAE
jgi:cell division protein FtsL